MNWFTDKKTPIEWKEIFQSETRKISLAEYAVGCLARMFSLLISTHQAMSHLEGMVGAADQFFAAQARRQNLPYADSKEVREALAFYRQNYAAHVRKQLQEAQNDAEAKV